MPWTATAQAPLRARRAPARNRWRRQAFRVLRGVLAAGLLATVAAAFVAYLADSPRFQVKRIMVQGNRALDPGAIRQAAGITGADTFMTFDPEEIAGQVERLPYVASCAVQRAYPDSVIIRVKEHQPAAAVLVNNHVYEVSASGIVLREIDPLGEYPGPLISSLPKLNALEPGQRIANPAFREAMAAWQAFAATPLAETLSLSEFAAPDPDHLVMYFNELPYELRWGRSEYVYQAHRLNLLWQQKGGTLPCEEYLDLRFGSDLVCK